MKFGLQLSPYFSGQSGNPWDMIEKAARLADSSAFDSIWLYDHFLYEGGFSGHPFSEPVMECLTTLAGVAAITRRIRLGQLVLGTPYRNPALVAKMATTLDHISHGRSILGIGAGWHVREHLGYGWGALEPVSIRMKRLEEAIQVILALWTERPANFAGTFYSLDNVRENPTPLQKPHPPLLIGGNGERKTLELVARYGQFCNVSGDPARVKHLFGVLDNHCGQHRRDKHEIIRSIYVMVIIGRSSEDVYSKQQRLHEYLPKAGEVLLAGTPEDLISLFQEYAQSGVQYVILRMPDWIDLEPLQLFAEKIIPALENPI
jgi:F420-dependent oxidoreductase-like protein